MGASQAADDKGLSIPILHIVLSQNGHSLKENEILKHCRYLEDKGLVKIRSFKNSIQQIDRDVVYITSKGIDVCEGTEVVEGVAAGIVIGGD